MNDLMTPTLNVQNRQVPRREAKHEEPRHHQWTGSWWECSRTRSQLSWHDSVNP